MLWAQLDLFLTSSLILYFLNWELFSRNELWYHILKSSNCWILRTNRVTSVVGLLATIGWRRHIASYDSRLLALVTPMNLVSHTVIIKIRKHRNRNQIRIVPQTALLSWFFFSLLKLPFWSLRRLLISDSWNVVSLTWLESALWLLDRRISIPWNGLLHFTKITWLICGCNVDFRSR